MTQIQLLDKTEIWVHGIKLHEANLPAIAAAVATVLALPQDAVFVTDVRDDYMVFDILVARVQLENIAGRKTQLLAALAALPGVGVRPDATIHSEGILGVIGTPRAEVDKLLNEAARLEENIRAYTARRVAVVSTGTELLDGRVKDTNLEAAREILGAAGFQVESGGMVGDDSQAIAGRVARLVSEGYGIVITTGGVGAEDKDCTVEALELIDPKLATAVLARYTAGHGRHVKDCVRIAIARVDWGIVIALPGPTHEVRMALGVLVEGLKNQSALTDLVEAMAVPLRASLPHQHRHAAR